MFRITLAIISFAYTVYGALPTFTRCACADLTKQADCDKASQCVWGTACAARACDGTTSDLCHKGPNCIWDTNQTGGKCVAAAACSSFTGNSDTICKVYYNTKGTTCTWTTGTTCIEPTVAEPAACKTITDATACNTRSDCYYKASNTTDKCVTDDGTCALVDATDTVYCTGTCIVSGTACADAACKDYATKEKCTYTESSYCYFTTTCTDTFSCAGFSSCSSSNTPVVGLSGTDIKFCKYDTATSKCVDATLTDFTEATCYASNTAFTHHWTGTACEKCASAGVGTGDDGGNGYILSIMAVILLFQ